MSRWIDADAYERELRTSNIIHHYGEQIVDKIHSAPSIDIVRCGECAKANTETCSHSYWDDDWGVWRVGYKGDDWFCADGEREGK